MKQFLVFLLAVVVLSCNKDENIHRTNTDIIMGSWYPWQVHLVTFNNSTNAIVKDTTFITSLCAQQSVIRFLPDSIVTRGFICDGIPVKEGKWYVTTDSISANIRVPLSYGTGVIYNNIGINKSQLIEIDEAHFISKETKWWSGFDGTNTIYFRDEVYTTLKRE